MEALLFLIQYATLQPLGYFNKPHVFIQFNGYKVLIQLNKL
jgi:hypothetical protein